MKWLNYHHLLYFKVIATEGSIAQASKSLLLGQSALSSQLKQLEDSLGQKLFERKNKRLILTEAGRVALEYADQIFKKGEEFVQVFNEKSLSSKSIYRIGVVASVPKMIASSLMQLSKEYSSNSVINMQEHTTEELFKKISTHELDIILTNKLNLTDKTDFQIKNVGKDNISIYGAKNYKKLIKGFPKSLNGAPIILPTMHSKLRYDLEHAFKSMKILYELVAEVQDSSVKKALGCEGIGLISLPDFAAKDLVAEGKLFKIGNLKNVTEEYWLISKKRTIKSETTEKLLENFHI